MTNKYPDLDPDGLGDLKEIKRISGMKKVAPKISWGKQYRSWPIEKRLDFAERLASAMNHAADVLQTERHGLIEVCAKQEEQIKEKTRQHDDLHRSMVKQLTEFNTERQKLNQIIVELDMSARETNRELKRLKKLLEAGDGDNG